MKTYYLNENKTQVIAVDSDGRIDVYNWMMETSNNLSSGTITKADNVKVPTLKKSNGSTDELPKKKRGRQVGSKNKTHKGDVPTYFKKEPITMTGIPKDLVQEYGITTVQAILDEKNRGIGYTGQEVYQASPVGCGHLTERQVQDVFDRLEQSGL